MPISLSLCYFALAPNVHTERWCTAMARRGHRVTLVPQGQADIKPLEGVTIHRVPWPTGLSGRIPKWRTKVYIHRVRRLFDACSADVYHMHWFHRGSRARRVMAGRSPLIISVWGSDIIPDHGESIFDQREKRLGLAQADLICATTHFLKEQTQRYCKPGTRIEVVPFGTDMEQFHPAETLVTEPIIGFVKHLLPKYGPNVLIEAMRIIVDGIPNARLVMAGKGGMEPQLRKRVEELRLEEHVQFLGSVPHEQVPDLTRTFAVMAMPSIYKSETFGVAAVEAESCGVPVVASRVGGIPEAVADGQTGLLVPPGDKQALAEALIKLLKDSDLRYEMGKRGRQHVAKRYDWQENLLRMEKLYFEMTGYS